MFKCQVCNKNSEPGEKAEKIYGYRPKTYHTTIKIKSKDREKKTREIVSKGNEITKEFTICKTCQENR